MACDRRTRLLISCYADGETTVEETARAKAHLENCADCRGLVEQWNGQRVMFEWAYTSQISDETTLDWHEELARKANTMSTNQRAAALPIRLSGNERRSYRWPSISLPTLGSRAAKWALAGTLAASVAAAIIVGLTMHHSAGLAPLIKVGAQLAAGTTTESARMSDNIQLKIGPNSIVSRINENTLRLEKGWVSAAVTNGSGLRIMAPRMEVVDQGTKFKVGTGDKLDYVMVDEGSVTASQGRTKHQVKAGQALTTDGKSEPVITSLPGLASVSVDPGEPLSEGRGSAFVPNSPSSMDFDAGIKKLAQQFPDVRVLSGEFRGGRDAFVQNGKRVEIREDYIPLAGIREGLRAHFGDIAQVMAGGKADSPGWKLPVAVTQFSGVESDPTLPGDVYILSLVCENGTLKWHLTGSLGAEGDLPFTKDKQDDKYTGTPVAARGEGAFFPGRRTHAIIFRLAEWPEELEPAVKVPLLPMPSEEDAKAEEFAARLSQVKGVDFENPQEASVRYLDPDRTQSVSVVWNKEAGKQLCTLSDMAKQGGGGTVTLGAMSTTMPLEEPNLPAGVYLMQFVMPKGSNTPRIELAIPAGASYTLRTTAKPSENGGGGNGWGTNPDSLPGYGRMNLTTGITPADGNAFPFDIKVIGTPDDRSTRPITEGAHTSYLTPTKTWAEGRIRIEKP